MKRALIDWDWSATGIWHIHSPSFEGVRRSDPRPWADLLSSALLDDLQRWNDECEDFFGPKNSHARVAVERPAYSARAFELASRVQDELGSDWEVLYNPGDEAWTWNWVTEPSRRGDPRK